ncbi:efflux transporter, RND family, MFP subunit [Cellulophaga algicola DSM 14237]|uniref:Efflux transporter, RND family, MFP subunit n=1 Tax=Cellulophaga algicola (strain DSM 14237 / IC166 / ACAM 630) TaxID=688270 RepID=E6X7Q3_CELAD|nr:efflux RND transporter periplasmic adaptor subunit [Cellulophaga algicola]ADV50763.1 efflux transporter, RND family, MFP subunit [Cellulophaga algicola DSM 14237]
MKYIINRIAITGVLTLLISCGSKEKTSVSKEKNSEYIEITMEQFNKNNMELGTFKEQDFPKIVSATGMIDVPPENKASVSATMGGYIKTTPLLIGDTVKKGQLLVTLENPEFVTIQQEYMELNEQLMYLKSEYDRQETMIAEKITSQKSFLKAESDYKTSIARRNGLKKQLEMLHISTANAAQGNFTAIASIYAPIAGSISKTFVSMGSYVSPASPILEIINNDHIHLELSVFEKDIMSIKKDQKIEFEIPEVSDQEYSGEVHLVGNSIDENRTIKIHGHIEDESKYKFISGMFVSSRIITSTEKRLALPSEAIVPIDDIDYVLVLVKKENDTYYFHQEEVKQNGNFEGFSLIENTNDFKQNTKFLTKGVFNLLGA